MSLLSHAFAATLLVASAAAEEASPWRVLPALPDPVGVAAPFAGVTGGGFLVAGGAHFPTQMPWEGGKKVWVDRAWFLETPSGAWKAVTPLSRPLAYGVSVTHRDAVICAGGSDAERHYPDAFRLRMKAGVVVTEPLPPLPIPLANATGALVGDTLHVAGGAVEPGEKQASNRAFTLDLVTPGAVWKELPAIPAAPRLLATAAAEGDAFYVIGGVALEPKADGEVARIYLRETWRYRTSEGWKRLGDLPHPNAGAPSPAPVVGGVCWIFGGDDGSRVGFQPVAEHPGFPARVMALDLAPGVWREAGVTPAPRATVPCAPWSGGFVIPSGEVRPGVRSPEVWMYSGAKR